jgi:hypothetical protein
MQEILQEMKDDIRINRGKMDARMVVNTEKSDALRSTLVSHPDGYLPTRDRGRSRRNNSPSGKDETQHEPL